MGDVRAARIAASWLVLSMFGPIPAAAQWSASRPDSHAPIGVMGDHRHHGGEVMLSYRFMMMSMEGSRDGTMSVPDADVVSASGYGFMVTPERMPMQMHMLGVMYAPTDRITLMGMAPYTVLSMDHVTRAGGAFTTESSGLGDMSVGALVGLAEFGEQSVHANLMVSVPTGSIEQKDVLPTSNGQDVQLPYPMQLGSGTVDLQPGITWLGQAGDWSWGVQTKATLRLGENDRGWTLGNRGMGTAWWARSFGRHASASVRFAATRVGDIEGTDEAGSVNPAVVPTARTDLRGGTTMDAGLGLNLYVPRWSAFRVAVEGLLPVYRDLHGPQLENDWSLVIGLQVVPVR
ncbi:MAG: transporter [Gemmatimonadota bacterium]